MPFLCSEYVAREFIDWSRIPDDPMFQLTFPQRQMLDEQDHGELRKLPHRGAGQGTPRSVTHRILYKLNPRLSGQLTCNAGELDGEPVPGLQHKYNPTVLFFPASAQTCHSYCTCCLCWAQFIGDADLRFSAREIDSLLRYLETTPGITDVIFTGGAPMIMGAETFHSYVAPLLEIDSVRTSRIGSKSLAFWPRRFVNDHDSDDLLRLFEDSVSADKRLAFMAHVSHPVELSTDVARLATRPFFARYDLDASWWNELKPLTDANRAFFGCIGQSEMSAS